MLKEEHRELDAILAEASLHLRDRDVGAEWMSRNWLRYDRWMRRHLEFLGGTIAPALRACATPEALRVEAAMMCETMALWDRYAAHTARFPPHRVENDWSAFRHSADELVAAIVKLAALSHDELFPVLETLSLLADDPTPRSD